MVLSEPATQDRTMRFMEFFSVTVWPDSASCWPEKNSGISRRYHWFPSEMTFEGRQQKIHTGSVSLHLDLDSASNWSSPDGNLVQVIKSTSRIWVVIRHQYGISALVPQTSFRGESSGRSVASRNVGCFLRLAPCWPRSTRFGYMK